MEAKERCRHTETGVEMQVGTEAGSPGRAGMETPAARQEAVGRVRSRRDGETGTAGTKERQRNRSTLAGPEAGRSEADTRMHICKERPSCRETEIPTGRPGRGRPTGQREGELETQTGSRRRHAEMEDWKWGVKDPETEEKAETPRKSQNGERPRKHQEERVYELPIVT